MIYAQLEQTLRATPRTWLVTGAAGFIGSSLVERLLELQQRVVGLDNFATGKQENIDGFLRGVNAKHFHFIEGDICSIEQCRSALDGVQLVLHQAALGSVPRSIHDPLPSHQANVDGFVNVLLAAKDAGVERFVYASSSSVYGDSVALPKHEDQIGQALSPYAVTKRVNELYADIFSRTYGLSTVGLRYFNVFGPRQDPFGAYAAVIPRWIGELRSGKACRVFGDGETSRDFCYIENVVQANLLAALNGVAGSSIFNIAAGSQRTLLQVYQDIARHVSALRGGDVPEPVFEDFRAGDVRHSLADISRAQAQIAYHPVVDASQGLERTVAWFLSQGS